MTGGIELVGWHTPLFASIASVKIIHVLIPKTAAMGRLMGRSAGFYVFLRTWQSPSWVLCWKIKLRSTLRTTNIKRMTSQKVRTRWTLFVCMYLCCGVARLNSGIFQHPLRLNTPNKERKQIKGMAEKKKWWPPGTEHTNQPQNHKMKREKHGLVFIWIAPVRQGYSIIKH